MVYGAVEHGCFGDVLFFEILRSDDLARQFIRTIFAHLHVARHIRPLRAPTRVMKMKPMIRTSRYDPSGPMAARWGGDLTI